MRIILTEDVPSLGTIGNTVSVKDGYARNYLLPRSKAILANESNTKALEHHKRYLEARRKKVLGQFQGMAGELVKLSLQVLKRAGADEKIFGSVTTAELAEGIKAAGHEVSKRQITIPADVKKLGTYEADVKLHSEVTAKVKFTVVAENAAELEAAKKEASEKESTEDN